MGWLCHHRCFAGIASSIFFWFSVSDTFWERTVAFCSWCQDYAIKALTCSNNKLCWPEECLQRTKENSQFGNLYKTSPCLPSLLILQMIHGAQLQVLTTGLSAGERAWPQPSWLFAAPAVRLWPQAALWLRSSVRTHLPYSFRLHTENQRPSKWHFCNGWDDRSKLRFLQPVTGMAGLWLTADINSVVFSWQMSSKSVCCSNSWQNYRIYENHTEACFGSWFK